MASLIQRSDRPTYYIQHRVGGKLKRECTHTDVLQIAKQKLRDFENARASGDESSLPTRTPIGDILTNYVAYIRTRKTDKSAQTETYYLREAFGPVCDAVRITSRKISAHARKRPSNAGQDRRLQTPVIEANAFEQITTKQVADFISKIKERRGLAAKTANHYRQILTRLFNWAIRQGGVNMHGDKNPAARVERYKENAPEIRFLTLDEIGEQLRALEDNVQLQAMVATLIYAGLRREEMLWLTPADINLKWGADGLIRVRKKTVGEESWQPKGRKNRSVPISSELRLYLDKWRLKRGKNDWFFPSPLGQHWEPDNFSADLRAINTAKALGTKGKKGKLAVPFGSLHYRHTFGSHLAIKGESLFKIAKLMGNSPEIVERHYADLNARELVDAVEFGPSRHADSETQTQSA